MGWENKFHCEWNEFGQKVLNYYWPQAECFGDITKSDFKKYNGTIDIISGGFPCQPYSSAGERKGKEDSRHLWPEMLRSIREIQPRWVVGENVSGIVNWSRGMVVKEIKTDLENEGFTLLPPLIIPACAKGANHRRDRTWFIAYSPSVRLQTINSRLRLEYKTAFKTPVEFTGDTSTQWSATKRGTGKVSRGNGISKGMDGITFSKWRKETIKAYGNAIVPQIAYEIFKTIQRYENNQQPE